MLTFTLIALLLYPDGHYIPLHIGENLTGARCAVEKERALLQLPNTLTVARLIAIKCLKNEDA